MLTHKLLAAAAGLVLTVPAFAQLPAGGSPPPLAPTVVPPPTPLAAPPVVPPPVMAPDFVGEPAAPRRYSTIDDATAASRGDRFWVSSEFLLGWIQGANVPPLVTTSPPGTPQASAGILGQAPVNTLFGGTYNTDVRSGFRFGSGVFFGPQRQFGLEAGLMFLESQSTIFNAASDGSAILARPYIDAATGTLQSVLVGFPGVSTGQVSARDSSGNFTMINLDVTEKLLDISWARFTGLMGYRYYRYDEGLRMRQTVNPVGATFVPGTQLASQDDFSTDNTFHGGDFGLRSEFFWRNLSLGVLTKLAAGKLYEQTRISGGTTTAVPGLAPTFQTGGVYALSSNSGTFLHGDWTVLPELGLNLGWNVRNNVRLTFGYSILWLLDVARAANQVDLTLNPTLFPPATAVTGPSRPQFSLSQSDIWIQSLTMGVQLNY